MPPDPEMDPWGPGRRGFIVGAATMTIMVAALWWVGAIS